MTVLCGSGNEPIKPIPSTIETDKKKVLLGKKLFNDPILSKDGTIACSSCHILQDGGDDNMKFSFGIGGKEGAINSPTIYNSVFNFRQFWDGRAKDLKDQVHGPVENPVEMGNQMHSAVEAIRKEQSYLKLFEDLYPDGVTPENIADAIAEFEKSLITPDSPFDKYLKGDENALSPQAKRGYWLFKSKGCVTCHHGINIGGNLYNKFGIFKESNSTNLGRYIVTKREEDRFVFRVPPLRNADLTAPYMHDGRATTLREAVVIMTQYQLGRHMEPEEIDDIVKFLKSLTGQIPQIEENRPYED
jgi:cytochrome c peroxidase